MLTDSQWMLLEPLVEECRPKGKTPPRDLRRTLEAILWGIRTAPSGGLCPRSLARGGGPRRPSSAGLAWVSGSVF
jgi:transposase